MVARDDNLRALPVGHKLNNYEIIRVLGQGGFGITYLASDTTQKVNVAIKEYFPRDIAVRDSTLTVKPGGQEDEKEDFKWGISRFIDEARNLARFDHPAIIKVQRFFEENGTAYLVMDYCEGDPLDKLLKGNKTLTQEQTNKILFPLLSALEEIHNANLVHRDIKPSNIYLKEDGSPVLLDFGAARSELMGHSRSITSLATPGYGAYEQYTTRGKQGPWTDIYGLGATLYKATCGRKAPDAPDRMLEDALEPPGIILGKFLIRSFPICWQHV